MFSRRGQNEVTLPKYIVFYEKFGIPFMKIGDELNTSSLKNAEILKPAPSRSKKNKHGALVPISFVRYVFWAIDTNQISLGTETLLRLQDENVYQKKEELGLFKEVFDLDNIVDLDGKSYVRTEEGCLVQNIFEEIEVKANWTGKMENGFCVGNGKYSNSTKMSISATIFEGELKRGNPFGYGCIKNGNTIYDCGEWKNGK